MLFKNFMSLEKDFDAKVKKYECYLVSKGEEVDTHSIKFAGEVKLLYCKKFLKAVAKKLKNKLSEHGIDSNVTYDCAAEEFNVEFTKISHSNNINISSNFVYPIDTAIQEKLMKNKPFVDSMFEAVLSSLVFWFVEFDNGYEN